jgi:hypothetical protein
MRLVRTSFGTKKAGKFVNFGVGAISAWRIQKQRHCCAQHKSVTLLDGSKIGLVPDISSLKFDF